MSAATKQRTPTRADDDSTAVPPGYKRTEVGVIPEDWEVSSVGAEFTIQLGKMLDAAKNVGAAKPYIGNRAVQWGRIDLGELSTVPMSSSDMQRFRLRRDDLLVCEGGEIGRAAIWNEPIPECYYQKALHRLRPVRGYDVVVMRSFLELWVATSYLSNYVTQTSIAHLPKDKFEVVPLPRPAPFEQRAIAEALSDVDGLLGALETLIAKKRAIKQGAMQQLLTGKNRLPGFNGPWETKQLGDIAQVWKGVQLDGSLILEQGPFPHLNGGISPSGFSNHFNTKGGTITVSEGGNSCGYVQLMRGPFWCGGHCYTVLPHRVDNRFLYNALKVREASIMALRVGSGLPNVQKTALVALEVSLPSDPGEQTAIATILSDMDADIAALERRRDKSCAIKQGMMQQLLTGQVRLVDSAPSETSA